MVLSKTKQKLQVAQLAKRNKSHNQGKFSPAVFSCYGKAILIAPSSQPQASIVQGSSCELAQATEGTN